MTRRYFWNVSDFAKFRTIFEDAETIMGADANDRFHLFRKDTGVISFDEAAARHLSRLKKSEKKASVLGKSKARIKKALSLKEKVESTRLIVTSPECCLQ